MINNLTLTNDERRDITLICFAETIIASVANRNKVGTRRHNQLLAAIERLERVDATYHGYLPASYQAQAEATLDKIENDLLALYEQE